jgi:hypothetical protein
VRAPAGGARLSLRHTALSAIAVSRIG